MESFLADYDIDFPRFQHLLQKTPSLLAGSAALALYLKENGIDPGYEPGDMDIWVLEYDVSGTMMETLFRHFLFEFGYYFQNVFENEENNNGQYDFQNFTTNHIIKVLSFINDRQKKIQIIVIRVQPLIEYICHAFDLSVCVSWWNAENNTFETLHPDLTKQRNVYISSPYLQEQEAADNRSKKLDRRLQKYIDRGFILCEPQCLALHRMDDRLALQNESCSLLNMTAFDLFAYDDVNVCEFLKSSWHIIVKAGDTFQAFHRKTLFDYMGTRHSELPMIGDVYDTPNNQTITSRARDTLLYSDFSIYELCSDYSITISPASQKSLFTVRCYSITEWEEGRPGDVFSPMEYSPHLGSVFESHLAQQRSELERLQVENAIAETAIIQNNLELIAMLDSQSNQLDTIEYALQLIMDAAQGYFHVQP
jgi:hypothetical protein